MEKKKKAKEQPKGILGNWIVRNLLLAVLFVALLIGGASLALTLVTQHNREVEVPDFTNMLFDEALPVAKAAGVKLAVTDSGYVKGMRRNAIYNQNPNPGDKVKRGRVIELTANSRKARKIAMPSLVGLSTQQAKTELANRGLSLGKLIYVKDIATNNVIRQQYRGYDIKAGAMIYSGSRINLVVGLSPSDNKTYVPDLIGKKRIRAVDAIHDSYLNVGKVTFDSSVKNYNDSLNAVVYSQNPQHSRRPYTMGNEVSIKLTLDPGKADEAESKEE